MRKKDMERLRRLTRLTHTAIRMVNKRQADETFGDRLKAARTGKQQTQPQAALELDIGQSTYNRWENDEVARIEVKNIPAVCAYLGLGDDTDYLGMLIMRSTVRRGRAEGKLP